jgi:hypothetical protein
MLKIYYKSASNCCPTEIGAIRLVSLWKLAHWWSPDRGRTGLRQSTNFGSKFNAFDFQALELCFPPTPTKQRRFIREIEGAQVGQRVFAKTFREAVSCFRDSIDAGRGEELPEIDDEEQSTVE